MSGLRIGMRGTGTRQDETGMGGSDGRERDSYN